MLKIFGAQGEIKNIDMFMEKINNFSQENNLTVQVFNSDLIFGEQHLISAFEHAKRSFENKTNTTNTLSMEILLYASGDRQLKIAIPKMGVKKGENNIAFVFVKKDTIKDELINEFLKLFSLKRNDKVLVGDKNTLRKFGISENEMKTVTEDKYSHLILEKIAMVDIIK